MIFSKQKNAQTLMEYLITLGVIVTVLVVMSPFMRRGIQSVLKLAADQIAPQSESDQAAGEGSSYLINAFTVTKSWTKKGTEEFYNSIDYIQHNSTVNVVSNSIVNMGFTERND